jgi:ubiquinone/menaquinone biosynthesis C-methylase UbiE
MSRRTDLTGTKNVDYDKVAKVYDQVRTSDPEMMHQILREVLLGRNSIILDIGCGTANNTLLVSRTTHARVVGIDLSSGMVHEAKKKAPEIHLAHASANHLPFRNMTFDLAFMTEVLHHLADVPPVISETFRVLRASGEFCIVTQSHEQIDHRMTTRFFPITAEIDKGRYPDIEVAKKHLRAARFINVRSKPFTFAQEPLGDEYLETVEKKGYSMLHKISEVDYQEGLKKLRAAYAAGERLEYAPGYTFIWGSKSIR